MKTTILIAAFFLALLVDVRGQDIFKTTCDNRFLDLSHAVVQTSDGGFLLAGQTYSEESGCMVGLVVKYDRRCDYLWKKEINPDQIRWIEVYDVTEDTEGNLLVAGRELSSAAGSYDAMVCKLNAGGDLIWKRTFGGTNHELAYKIIQTKSHDIMVAGTSNSNDLQTEKMMVARLNGKGELLWSNTYGDDLANEAYSIIELANGEFVVVGSCSQCAGTIKNLTVMRLDGDGNMAWTQTLYSSHPHVGFNVVEDKSGNIVVSGVSKKKNKCRNYLLLARFTPAGELLWEKNMKMKGCVGITSLACSGNDGIFVGGTLYNFPNDMSRIFIIRMDENGHTSWSRMIDGLGHETCNAMILTREQDLILAGEMISEDMNTDILLVKTSLLPGEK